MSDQCTHGDLTAHGRECPWCQVAALQADNDKLEMEASEYLMRIKELEAKVRVVDKMVAALGITYAELNDAIPEQPKEEG